MPLSVALDTTSINSIPLPDLIHQVLPDSSSSTFDEGSLLSLDTTFEISKFQTLKILMQNFETVVSSDHLSQNFKMESNYVDAAQPLTQENSGTSNDEILKILRAISSQMITGQQDLQLEIQCVRDDHEKFKQEVQSKLCATSPTVSLDQSSPVHLPVAPQGINLLIYYLHLCLVVVLQLHHRQIFKIRCWCFSMIRSPS
jgi:hypothetical protein